MSERKFADVFPPGEFIKEELEARGWTQDDLAEILGRPLRAVNDIINAKRGITPDTAKGLGAAFGTSAQLWMNLESIYRLSLEKNRPESISRKAALYSAAPIRAMIKRNWIENSTNIEVLEQRSREFFGASDLNQIPELCYMARKSTKELTLEQRVWLFRVKNLAQAVHAEKYSKTRLNLALEKLKTMLADEADIRLIPKVLADAGIKLLIVEPLPQSKIDGVSFWVNGTPVIALSLRYDRIDSFWHTLMHEIGHIKHEDGLIENRMVLDIDLFDGYDDDKPYEKKADEFAVNFLVPQKEINNFMIRIQTLYSKSKITGFANKIEVHPGIVVGQLHHIGREKGGLDYANFREMLVKIRHHIVTSALTDGYEQLFPTNLIENKGHNMLNC
jgi:HTH-type transcriptional regulator/antitoxin HigA